VDERITYTVDKVSMTNIEYYQKQAKMKAKIDFEKRLFADTTRHNARYGSAWASHYQKCYSQSALKKYEIN